MKARFVNFFAGSDRIPDVKRRINEEVLPRFSAIDEFLGFIILQSVGSRPEIIAISFGDRGLDGSEAISEEFRDEMERVTGAVTAATTGNVSGPATAASKTCRRLDRPPGDRSCLRRRSPTGWICP